MKSNYGSAMYGVVLAGGGGARLWPVSREFFPKQFLSLGGNTTLLQNTILRLRRRIPRERLLVVTHEDIVLEVKAQLARLSERIRILREPFGRNTAAAVGLAAAVLEWSDPEAVMVVVPADHVIRKEGVFYQRIQEASQVARKNLIVTFGIRPAWPEPGYGYIQIPARAGKTGGVRYYPVTRFVEKPDAAAARRYVASGRYFWNSGIFVWKASVILEEIQRHMPNLYAGLKHIQSAIGTHAEERVLRNVYEGLKPLSIDHGVLQASDRVAMLPADMDWADVGDWAAVGRLAKKGPDKNAVVGDAVVLDSSDSVVYSTKRLVAAMGMKNQILVETADAVLVCPKDRAVDLKKMVDVLKSRRPEICRTPNIVSRPWGSFELLLSAPTFQVKRLFIRPRASISLQLHRHRSEHWVVVRGTARVTHGKRKYLLHTNESTYISPKTRHALSNATARPLEIIEVQSGNYLGEDDIVRFHDPYRRFVPEPPLSERRT